MAKIGVLTCQKIRDIHCMGCIKCHKAIANRDGNFADYDEIDVVFWAGCGDCPGLYMPKVDLLNAMTGKLGREYDIIHIGTCIQKAVETAACPIDLDLMKKRIEGKFGKKVVIGTHTY